jgi:hypothetical protein
MTSTVLDLINEGFFKDTETILIAVFVALIIQIVRRRTKIAICDATFELQRYFYNNIPENFTIFIKIHEVNGFLHFFRYYIKVEILYDRNSIYIEDSPAFKFPWQVHRYKEQLMKMSPFDLCTKAHNKYLEKVIDNLDGETNG